MSSALPNRAERDGVTAQSAATKRFAVYAWGGVLYLIGVILWGAYVRASGSGAGCGEHWPLCNGTVMQQAPSMKTLIELSHRVTSGLSLVIVGGLVWQAFRRFPKGSAIRQGMVFTAVFLVLEAALGAGLVKLQLVADNATAMRAVAVAIHLVNTFLLLGALIYTAFFATLGRHRRLVAIAPWPRRAAIFGTIALFLATGAAGAVVALGDTLFKATSLADGIMQDFSPTAHFLIRLRMWHPALAIVTATAVLVIANVLKQRTADRRLKGAAIAVCWAVSLQVALGTMNLAFLAPIWLQMAHLFAADATWATLIIFSLLALESTPARESNAAALAPQDAPAQ